MVLKLFSVSADWLVLQHFWDRQRTGQHEGNGNEWGLSYLGCCADADHYGEVAVNQKAKEEFPNAAKSQGNSYMHKGLSWLKTL